MEKGAGWGVFAPRDSGRPTYGLMSDRVVTVPDRYAGAGRARLAQYSRGVIGTTAAHKSVPGKALA